jgi:hypothetical protein
MPLTYCSAAFLQLCKIMPVYTYICDLQVGKICDLCSLDECSGADGLKNGRGRGLVAVQSWRRFMIKVALSRMYPCISMYSPRLLVASSFALPTNAHSVRNIYVVNNEEPHTCNLEMCLLGE